MITRQSIRAHTPKWAIHALKVVREHATIGAAFVYDYRRYLRHSASISRTDEKGKLRAVLTERYHSIEKGLSLANPRPGFGSKPIGDIVELFPIYVNMYGRDTFTSCVVGVLSAYLEFNAAAGTARADVPHIDALEGIVRNERASAGGTRQVARSEILSTVNGVEKDFFLSRHSTRQFSSLPVTEAQVQWAAEVAAKSPAVCNRQFARLHVYLDALKIASILRIQGGARGFAEEVGGLAVITTSANSYWKSGQRNQGWVDGGLFAMSFMLGLHAQGLGSIALNWSKTPTADRLMRSELGLGADEMIIMLVAFGNLRTSYTVANSARLPLGDILRLHR